MKTQLLVLAATLIASAFCIAASDQFRFWTNKDGVKIEARYLETKEHAVVLQKRTGPPFEYPLEKLSEADAAWAQAQAAAAAQAERDSHGIAFDPLMTRPGAILFEDSLGTVGEGWNAGNGDWQIVDGVLAGKELAADDHAATFKRKIAFQNAVIQYAFKLEGAKSTTFSVNDSVDHVCRVLLNSQGFSTQKDDHDHEGPDKAIKFQTTEMDLEPGEWHTLLIEIMGDTLVAQIDGEKHVSFGSHPLLAEVEKASVGFTINGESVHFKDLKIWEALPNETWEATRRKLERRRD